MDKLMYVIKRPIVSEKSTALAEVANRYVFEVAANSTKTDIKRAVSKLFSVKVKKVWTMVNHGEIKTAGKSRVKRPNWKKAIVALEEGQKIELFQIK